ncbi:MAG: hypothetical protein ACLFNP_03820 [Spirochaetaceae bacterium]
MVTWALLPEGLYHTPRSSPAHRDDDVRTGNAMIIDCYGGTIIETSGRELDPWSARFSQDPTEE